MAGYPDAVPGFRAPAIVLALAVALIAAACGGTAPTSDVTTAPTAAVTPTPAATPSPPTDAPATDAPTEAPTGPVTEPPTEAPSVEPPGGEPSAAPTATSAAGGAEACSGSDANREFLAKFARAVDWPVLCGVLPKRWFVGSGTYRTANGGWMFITYNGPNGARLGFYEGSYCEAQGDCPVLGTDLGPAPLGPLAGTLYATDDGYAVVVDPGSVPTWVMTTTGLDEATTLQLAAAAAEVGG